MVNGLVGGLMGGGFLVTGVIGLKEEDTESRLVGECMFLGCINDDMMIH